MSLDLPAYFARIGYTGAPATDLETLRQISRHRVHETRLAGFLQGFAGRLLDGGFVALFLDQRFPLVGQAGKRGTGILRQSPLAGKVGSDLGKPALVGVARLGDAPFLGVQRLAGDHQPLQCLRRLGFGLPQLR